MGVELRPLSLHWDARGNVCEIFRAEWWNDLKPVQWNVSSSEPGVLRGVHVHLRRHDYLVLVSGRATAGLCDLRSGSPTEGHHVMFDLLGDQPAVLTIPPGVAHGFYFHVRSLFVLGMTGYWTAADDLGCHWADPGLGLSWPEVAPSLSDKDAVLPPLRETVKHIPPWQRPSD